MVKFAVEKAGKQNFLIKEDGKRLELFCLDKRTADRVASALVHQNDSGLEEMEIAAAARSEGRKEGLEEAVRTLCGYCERKEPVALIDGMWMHGQGLDAFPCRADLIRALMEQSE